MFSCLKGAEDGDGLMLRCFNPSVNAVTARVEGDFAVVRLRLDETGAEPLTERMCEVAAGQVATVRLRPRE